MVNLRREIAEVIGIQIPYSSAEVPYKILETTKEDGYTRQLIEYASGGDKVSAFLLLSQLAYVDVERIGTLGHSYGGNTALFLSALDERIAFCCASGSACTYENRMKHDVGIEMASVIPNFHGKYDIDDLVSCIAPRRLLIVSGEEDKYSRDASYIVERGSVAYSKRQALHNLCHKRYPGGHEMTQEKFDTIIGWIEN